MTAAEKVIQIARAELGYREKRSNSALGDKTANAGSANWTKYARDLDAMTDFYNGPKQGFAWCDVFVDWCFYKAFGADTAKKLLCQPAKSAGAGCTYSLAYYNQHGQFYARNPKPGDQIFFGSVGNSSHTGLVTAVSIPSRAIRPTGFLSAPMPWARPTSPGTGGRTGAWWATCPNRTPAAA